MSIRAPQSPDTYWVEPGMLLAGEYPGHAYESIARQKVETLVDTGIRVFIDLTEAGEYGLVPYESFLDTACAAGRDVTYRRLSIRDVSVPPRSHMRQIPALIADSLNAGRPVYVHCWGGTVRTGTVVGCWLVEQGRGGADPIQVKRPVRRYRAEGPTGLRHPTTSKSQVQLGRVCGGEAVSNHESAGRALSVGRADRVLGCRFCARAEHGCRSTHARDAYLLFRERLGQ